MQSSIRMLHSLSRCHVGLYARRHFPSSQAMAAPSLGKIGWISSSCSGLRWLTSPVNLHLRVPPRLKGQLPEPNGKPPFVILHGMLGSASNWRTIMGRPDLFHKEGDFCCAIDLRNHGSSDHASTMTYDEMCEDVLAFSEKLGVKRAHLIGHSMGGKVAMTLALRYPERVASLCVVDIAPVEYAKNIMHMSIIDAMLNMDLSQVTSAQSARALLKKRIADVMTREFVLTNLVADKTAEGVKWKWKVNLNALRQGIKEGDLASFPAGEGNIYDGPCLVIRGSNSNYVQDQHLPVIAELFPNSEVSTIEGAGHWVHHEKPDEFIKALSEWYSKYSID